MDKCPHIDECKQKIVQGASEICKKHDVEDWSFEECFKWNDMEEDYEANEDDPRKTPKEWINSS